MAPDAPVALFFFAHQDDEFGVFEQIAEEVRKGHRVLCAYLTDGGTKKALPECRNHESLTVLKQLGVPEDSVYFAGGNLAIPDAGLPTMLERAVPWIQEWLSNHPTIESIYVPAWEGGHHDHDALHAVVVRIANEKSMLHLVRQFPLYNGFRCRGPFFRVLTPISENGTAECRKISWANRLRFLKYCLSYPSQAGTWVGLFPFVLLHYAFKGEQALQSVSIARLSQRPHKGRLYYERRKFFTWEKMAECLGRLGVTRVTPPR